MDLNEVRVFVQVARLGSFTAAARRMGMPNSTVSAKVTALERRLGASLLKRTTRKLHLTEAGERYFERCAKALGELEAADRDLGASQLEPQGLLRITAPVDMGSACLIDLTRSFSVKYPKVQLEFIFTDRTVDLVGEGVDLAIRAGELSDSSLIARKLGESYLAPYASPAYLKRAGVPRSPQELRDHECLIFTQLAEEAWELRRERSMVKVRVSKRMIANDMTFLKSLAVSGAGIAMLPAFVAEMDVKTGRLQRVLPDWRSEVGPIHVVYAEQKFLAPKTRLMVEEVVKLFRALLGS